jgi:hypothetical protein
VERGHDPARLVTSVAVAMSACNNASFRVWHVSPAPAADAERSAPQAFYEKVLRNPNLNKNCHEEVFCWHADDLPEFVVRYYDYLLDQLQTGLDGYQGWIAHMSTTTSLRDWGGGQPALHSHLHSGLYFPSGAVRHVPSVSSFQSHDQTSRQRSPRFPSARREPRFCEGWVRARLGRPLRWVISYPSRSQLHI